MSLKKIIFTFLLLFSLIFSLSTETQAVEFNKTEYKDIQATEILKKIENGEDINLIGYRIKGEVSLQGIENLETVPNTRKTTSVPFEERLKVVKSNIKIKDSIFEDYVDFSGASFKDAVSFEGTDFLSKTYFSSVDFEAIPKPIFYVYSNFSKLLSLSSARSII